MCASRCVGDGSAPVVGPAACLVLSRLIPMAKKERALAHSMLVRGGGSVAALLSIAAACAFGGACSTTGLTLEETQCEPNSCQNGGVCKVVDGVATCDCTNTAFTGTTCEQALDGGRCAGQSCNHGTCEATESGFRCSCESGWEGERCDVATLKDPNRLGVFLLAGQSNMEGNVDIDLAGRLIDELTVGSPSERESRVEAELNDWYSSDELEGAASAVVSKKQAQEVVRLHDAGIVDSTLLAPYPGAVCSFNDSPLETLSTNCGLPFGLELTFARAARDTLKGPLSIVKVAEGGTRLYDAWLSKSAAQLRGRPVGRLYQDLVDRIHAIKDEPASIHDKCAEGPCEWAAFVWFQGENDVFDDDEVGAAPAQEYEENLRRLIADVRLETGAPKLPVVIVQIGYWAQSLDNGMLVQAAQSNVVQADPHAALVETDDLSRYYHYDPAAQWIIGERAWNAVKPYMK